MPESQHELHAERSTAVSAAVAASHLLQRLRALLTQSDVDPDLIRRKADRASHACISNELARRFPADPILSEESPDDTARIDAPRVWIVDPLDGTREFGEPGRTDWAVHVALVIDGVPQVGVVALPGQGRVVIDGDRAAIPSACGPPRILVSRTRPPREAEPLRAALDGMLRPLGSAGAKTVAVVDGEADVYLHSGGQYEWDSAAPVAVAAAAGLHASRLDGSPLVYNRYPPELPDLLICRPQYAERALAAIRAAGSPAPARAAGGWHARR